MNGSVAGDDPVGQRRVGRVVGEVFGAAVEAHVRPTLAAVAVTDRAEQHRILRLQAVQQPALGDRSGTVEGPATSMRTSPLTRARFFRCAGQDNPDHGNTWTSTESTAGRSRTIGAQLSPLSAEW